MIRKDLVKIVPYDAFDSIEIGSKGFIGRQDLAAFYAKCQTKIKPGHLEFLFRGLQRKTYKYITLEAFCENLNPLENSYSQEYISSFDLYKQRQI